MISLFQQNRHFRKVSVNKTFTHVQEQKKSDVTATLRLHSAQCEMALNYLQKKGCAMRPKCAPSYGNIFVGWFEKKLVFPLLTNLSDFYLRFIDDIWNGTKTEFDDFLKKICIKFSTTTYYNINLTVLFQFQETSYSTKLKHLILNVYHLLLRITVLYLTSKQ